VSTAACLRHRRQPRDRVGKGARRHGIASRKWRGRSHRSVERPRVWLQNQLHEV